MHFTSESRYNAKTGRDELYYRIKESYRNSTGTVCTNSLLTIGFMEKPLEPEQLKAIAGVLNARRNRDPRSKQLMDDTEGLDPIIAETANLYWDQIVMSGKLDRIKEKEEETREACRKYMDTDTADNDPSRHVGAEWLILQTLKTLKFRECLLENGFTEKEIKAALACLTTRTIYPTSELNAYKEMRGNSAICDLVYGCEGVYPTFREVYSIPDKLYAVKKQLEAHFCNMTDNLFNNGTRILLYDLTNFYFEGRKGKSKLAQFGRSKEKRSDCKIVVLALCIDTEGFIRYSAILEGNTADPNSLPDMVDNVILSSNAQDDSSSRSLIVIDAGIATEENLEIIKSKGFNYLCVSRKKPKNVELKPGGQSVTVLDARKREIKLDQLKPMEGQDNYIQVTSPAKRLTESSMNRQFKERFETELRRAQDGLTKKHGTKAYEKVIERVGRAQAHYPSIAKYYEIKYTVSETNPKHMGSIEWRIKIEDDPETLYGKYYLRTNVLTYDERVCWEYYNLIREIECTNHQLKTDLQLRPIHHKTDGRCEAHLFMGLLSYTIINTIRHQLKGVGENCFWKEIIRRMESQNITVTRGLNPYGEEIRLCICSKPSSEGLAIYRALGYKERPFVRRRTILPRDKICSTFWNSKKNENASPEEVTP